MTEDKRILFLDTDTPGIEALVGLLSRTADYRLRDYKIDIEDHPETVLNNMKSGNIKYDLIICEYNLKINGYEFLSKARQLNAYKKAILFSDAIDHPGENPILLRELINEKLITKLIDKSCGPGMAVSEIIASIDDLDGNSKWAIETIGDRLITDENFNLSVLRKQIVLYLKREGHSTSNIARALGVTRPTVYADLKD